MKIVHIIVKVLFSIILLMPVLGVLGIFPEPTPDLYNTEQAYAFIKMLGDTKYTMILVAITDVLAVTALWTRREALGAALAAPITVNVTAFHLFLDGGLLTPGAIMVDVMLLANLYLVWKNWDHYKPLLEAETKV